MVGEMEIEEVEKASVELSFKGAWPREGIARKTAKIFCFLIL